MREFLICVVGASCLLSGCATKMTVEGATVRQISPDTTALCTFVAVVEASNYMGNTMGHDQQGAINEVRNQVAAMGGNAFLIMHIDTAPIGTVIQAEGYLCPETVRPPSQSSATIQPL